MLKRLAVVFALLVLVPRLVDAQTVNRSLEWDHLADTLANVNSYTFALKIDAAPATVITPTCATVAPNVHCAQPITLTSGTHTIVVTAINAGGSASGSINNTPPPPPTQPVNITITIHITVP